MGCIIVNRLLIWYVMKTVAQLAYNLNIHINVINRIIKQQRLVNCGPMQTVRLINEYQEEWIQQCLILEGYLDGYIFESKMQEIPEQEDFNVFKKRTYTKYTK